MMSQSAVIRARYVPDVRGVNRYKHFHSPLVTETNEAGENIDKRGLPHELPYLDTGDLIRYSGRLESDVTFPLSDDDYLHSKAGLSSRQRISMGLLHINTISNTSHPLSLSSSLPVLATASKPSCNLKPLSKRTNGLNKSAQNIYSGSDEHFMRLATKRHHRSCYAKLSESDTLRCINGESASRSPGSLACKPDSSWPSSSLRLVQVPKANEKKGRNLNCCSTISQRINDVLSTSDTTLGHEMTCQRKDPVLVDCAAGNDETFSTKTLGTQTSVFEGKDVTMIESSTCKATQTQTSSSCLSRAVHDYDTEIEQRDELIKLIDSALNETIDRCSRLRTNQFIASSLRKQAQVWRDAKEFVTSVLLPQSILLANNAKSSTGISYGNIAAIHLP